MSSGADTYSPAAEHQMVHFDSRKCVCVCVCLCVFVCQLPTEREIRNRDMVAGSTFLLMALPIFCTVYWILHQTEVCVCLSVCVCVCGGVCFLRSRVWVTGGFASGSAVSSLWCDLRLFDPRVCVCVCVCVRLGDDSPLEKLFEEAVMFRFVTAASSPAGFHHKVPTDASSCVLSLHLCRPPGHTGPGHTGPGHTGFDQS